MNQIISKPWGREIIFTPKNHPYTCKILEIKAGHRLSLQSHDQKTETLVLASGQAQITLNDQTKTMQAFTGYTIKPNTAHRIAAITSCLIFEASTPEIGTTKRIQDDYHRPNETPSLRSSSNRGWSKN